LSQRMPRKLKPGDTICILAPGSPVGGEGPYAAGKAYLERKGYRVAEAEHLQGRHLLFAGEDHQRAADVNAAFSDPSIDAIFCARGGTGTLRLLPHVDYRAVSRNPKILLGYSDITALQAALYAKCGLVSFYGPMVTTEIGRGLTPYTEQNLFETLTCTGGRQLVNPPDDPPETLCEGEASGELLGGCLSIFVSLLGTPYEPDTRGTILFFEDIDETPHRIDRFLTQLILAEKLQAAAGIIFGTFRNAAYPPDHAYAAMGVSAIDLVRDRISGLGVPALWGLKFGHEPDMLTMPIGAVAHLDASRGIVTTGPCVW
jgi:muramoyltetrapeptide carboxypeptidase